MASSAAFPGSRFFPLSLKESWSQGRAGPLQQGWGPAGPGDGGPPRGCLPLRAWLRCSPHPAASGGIWDRSARPESLGDPWARSLCSQEADKGRGWGGEEGGGHGALLPCLRAPRPKLGTCQNRKSARVGPRYMHGDD